jgi:hypothetical protein
MAPRPDWRVGGRSIVLPSGERIVTKAGQLYWGTEVTAEGDVLAHFRSCGPPSSYAYDVLNDAWAPLTARAWAALAACRLIRSAM